jgi:hypothetical protein
MPLPGSQEIESLSFAYFLFSFRWSFRILLSIMILAGILPAWKHSRILVSLILILTGVVIYMTKFRMAADRMFYPPSTLILDKASENSVDLHKLVIGVAGMHEAKAYPIQFIGFHHQVRDSLDGKPIMVTYCTVCRTGRVFEPIVNGHIETFRLVGMDHYNAMFEDKTTRTWWRQETGEAVAGPLKGMALNEIPSTQTTLGTWLALHPESFIMQPDPSFQPEYDSLADYESGKRTGRLTSHDTASWHDKSWVAGISWNNEYKAYDWNKLLMNRIINDHLASQPIVVFIASDQKSLFAYKRISSDQQFSIRNDTLTDGALTYNLLGQAYQDPSLRLQPIQVYQEYWHSWKFFHPKTLQYDQ